MARLGDLGDWRVVHGAVVLLVIGFFLFSLREILSPIVLFLVLLLVLVPYVGTRLHLLVVTGTTLLAALWLLKTTGFLLAPFILALVLAYIFDPLVDVLERRRLRRPLAIAVLALPGIGLVVLGLVVGLPALVEQIGELIRRAPMLVARAVEWVEDARRGIMGIDIPLLREEVLLERLRSIDPEAVVAFLEDRLDEIVTRSWQAVLGFGRGLGTALTVIGYVVLTPVLTYYILRDYDRITSRVGGLIPQPKRQRWLAFLRDYDALLSGYLRGQVVVAAIVGVLTGVLLWIARFPYPALIGAVAGVFNLVPYLGLIASLVPALVIAFVSGDVLLSLLKILLVFGAVQILDSSVLSPRIVGGSVGLHPVWIILALAVGGFFFGFVGVLLAVPAAVLMKLLVRVGLERYHSSRVYRGRVADEGAG